MAAIRDDASAPAPAVRGLPGPGPFAFDPQLPQSQAASSELPDAPQPAAHGKAKHTPVSQQTGAEQGRTPKNARSLFPRKDFPSLMDLAAPHCVEGAVAGMQRQLKNDKAEVAALSREGSMIRQALLDHRDTTRRLIRAVRPREPAPAPNEVQELSDAALAAAMPTRSLGEAAGAVQLTGEQLWTMLQR